MPKELPTLTFDICFLCFQGGWAPPSPNGLTPILGGTVSRRLALSGSGAAPRPLALGSEKAHGPLGPQGIFPNGF